MPEQFHPFGELPIELRLKIWVHTWEPRTVTLFPANGVYSLRRTDKIPLPTSAYVNTESRGETLRHYKCCFVGDSRWFNFRLDTLCIAVECGPEDLESLDPSNPGAVRALSKPFSSRLDSTTNYPVVYTRCDLRPEPVIKSFKSPRVEKLFQKNSSALSTSRRSPYAS
ncbi:hypothetical protein F4680DRAFT_180364 [Xylaria scruposa]|nr:hypothetical protein F4680DRAFT_180364 [Xylaria scruposa]